MATLNKEWNDGGSLSVSYEGDGDGSAVFSSDDYEGIDREMTVTYKGGGIAEKGIVRQEGTRQPFRLAGGGIFRLANGGRFGVLKQGGVVPPTPVETYTRLTYIECNGTQYIDLGYVVQENDAIEIRYIPTVKESGRFYGTVDSTGNSIYWSFSQGDGYARFGQKSSKSINEGIESSFCILQKGSVSIDTYTTTLTYSAMPTTPIYLFACYEEGQAINKASFRCRGFSIHNDNGDVMRLLPYKRDSDGVIGMLDEVSRRFFTNDGEGVFIAGSAMVLPDGYTFIEEVSFNADTLYDMGLITSEDSIDIQYKREDTSSSQYLYGITNSNNTASVTAYLASNGAWRFGSQLVRPNTADKNVHHTTISNGAAIHDGSAMVMNTSPVFVTENTVVLGGYRDASGITTKGYIGKVLYIRINDGTKIDWLPCKRLSDGVEGFWDCVTQTFIEPL